MTENNKLSWYVVQAYSGYENRVAKLLIEKIELNNMGSNFGQILVPSEKVVEIRSGQKRKSERKFFPGYVLIEMSADEESWRLVKGIPRVLGFIGGTKEKPSPITQKEADKMLSRISQDQDTLKPRNLFVSGEVVRIKEGPFADFTATVESVNYDKSRLQVSVSIFGRPTPVELEFFQVDKVD